MTLFIWASGLDQRQSLSESFPLFEYSSLYLYRHPHYCASVQKTSWRTSSAMPQQPWMVFLTVLHSVALLSTIFRVAQRWSASRLWWDDFLLLLPLGLDATYLASLWVLYHRSFVYDSDKGIIDSFWFTTLLWFLIIW